MTPSIIVRPDFKKQKCCICSDRIKTQENSRYINRHRNCLKFTYMKVLESTLSLQVKVGKTAIVERYCSKCGKVKPIVTFYNNIAKTDNKCSWCIPCSKAYAKALRNRIKEHIELVKTTSATKGRMAKAIEMAKYLKTNECKITAVSKTLIMITSKNSSVIVPRASIFNPSLKGKPVYQIDHPASLSV